jgi:hypothetical protein
MPAHFHHVPGRLRVNVPTIKGSTARAKALEESLSKLLGVSHVEGRTITGSVVVHYDATALNLSELLQALNISGEAQPRSTVAKPETPHAVSHQLASKAAKMLIGYTLEKAVERTIPLLLGALL